MPNNHSFLAGSNIAVYGISSKRDTFAKAVRDELQKAGFVVYTMHPSGESGSFAELESLPEKAESVYVATSKKNASSIADKAIAYAAKRIWFQFGSYNKDIVNKCKDAGLETHAGCLMMYIPGTGVMHSVHRFFHELIVGKP